MSSHFTFEFYPESEVDLGELQETISKIWPKSIGPVNVFPAKDMARPDRKNPGVFCLLNWAFDNEKEKKYVSEIVKYLFKKSEKVYYYRSIDGDIPYYEDSPLMISLSELFEKYYPNLGALNEPRFQLKKE